MASIWGWLLASYCAQTLCWGSFYSRVTCIWWNTVITNKYILVCYELLCGTETVEKTCKITLYTHTCPLCCGYLYMYVLAQTLLTIANQSAGSRPGQFHHPWNQSCLQETPTWMKSRSSLLIHISHTQSREYTFTHTKGIYCICTQKLYRRSGKFSC